MRKKIRILLLCLFLSTCSNLFAIRFSCKSLGIQNVSISSKKCEKIATELFKATTLGSYGQPIESAHHQSCPPFVSGVIHVFYAFPEGEDYDREVSAILPSQFVRIVAKSSRISFINTKPLSEFANKYHFKIVRHDKPSIEDLKSVLANENEKTIILWSSHGGFDGTLFDYYGKPIPGDVFINSNADLTDIVVSSCYNGKVQQKYRIYDTNIWTTEAISTVSSDDFKTIVSQFLCEKSNYFDNNKYILYSTGHGTGPHTYYYSDGTSYVTGGCFGQGHEGPHWR